MRSCVSHSLNLALDSPCLPAAARNGCCVAMRISSACVRWRRGQAKDTVGRDKASEPIEHDEEAGEAGQT